MLWNGLLKLISKPSTFVILTILKGVEKKSGLHLQF